MKSLSILFLITNFVIFLILINHIRTLDMKMWSFEKTSILLRQGKVPNMVSIVYMKNRVFDTLFEVLVFSIAVFGVREYHVSHETKVKHIKDKNYRYLLRYFAFFAMLTSIYLAITGHLSPGGGFSAGVAGGTAVLLLGISIGIEDMEKRFERLKLDLIERNLVFIVIILAFFEYKFDITFGKFGEILSGGLIPFQSLVIYLKVFVGVWIIIYNFMKHRGII